MSCVEDSSTFNDNDVNVEELAQVEQTSFSQKSVSMKHSTLEEIQALVEKHNLPPIRQESIDMYNSRMAKGGKNETGPCPPGHPANKRGDLNENGTFSASDLVTFGIICGNSGLCPNACGYDPACDTYAVHGSNPSHPVFEFGEISGVGTPAYPPISGTSFIFNKQDYDFAIDWILGNIQC